MRPLISPGPALVVAYPPPAIPRSTCRYPLSTVTLWHRPRGWYLLFFSVPRGNDTCTPKPRPSINNSLSLGVGCCVPLVLLSPAALTPLVDSCMLLRWPKGIDRCLFLRSLAAKIRAPASSSPYPPSPSTSTKGIPLLPPYLTLMALPTIITNNALRRLIIVSFCNLHGIHVFGRARLASRP